uniref:transposase n=1 Tax=Marnyiella aurantia TaxID=2758037 RepID=UPI001FD79DB2|nr:transposase [Marnyiella aurantia]
MQGKKKYTPKIFYQLSLDALVPEDNFYRKIQSELSLDFFYKGTRNFYGKEGQASIDPIVFFKILLFGYLNNINSDRALLRYCSNSLDVRLFLGYDLDEELPWHSTLSRTRQLFGEELFLELFRKVLSLCVEKGMVRGKRQAVDSAFIKANASMDSLVEKEVLEDASALMSWKKTANLKPHPPERNWWSSTTPGKKKPTKACPATIEAKEKTRTAIPSAPNT